MIKEAKEVGQLDLNLISKGKKVYSRTNNLKCDLFLALKFFRLRSENKRKNKE